MGVFAVRFGTEASYNDVEYMFIVVKIIGEAQVSCDHRTGDENDIETVRRMIAGSLMETATRLASEKCPYDQLVAHRQDFSQGVADTLKGYDITLNSFNIMNIAPVEKSQRIIDQRKKLKAFQAMSPEELAKKAEEANAAAQRYLDSLSPEERHQAEENARKMAEAEYAERQKLIDEAKRIAAGGPVVATAASAAAAAASAGNKFCTNCGAPSSGGRFCSNCGSPL